ncbi:MAG: hypothetical protein MJZ42_05450 [Bacteroidales bacterium]|nr:hypothetical protein [Bacteroidales bacterium]
MRWRPWLPPFAGVVGRLAVEDAAVARLDVVVERPEARDILVGKCFYDALARVVGRAPQLHDEVPEQDRHADRELHARAHVGLARPNRLPGLLEVVLGVDPPVAVADRPVGRAAVVFAPPGLVGDAVDPGEVPQRDPAASVDVAVPGDSQCFALPVGQSVPGCLVYAILSLAHDVGLACLG